MIASNLVNYNIFPVGGGGQLSSAAAGGTNQATATPLALNNTMVVASGTGGVKLGGPGTKGDTAEIVAAVAATLYTQSANGTINGAASYALTAGHVASLLCLKQNVWFVTQDVALTGTIPSQEEMDAG